MSAQSGATLSLSGDPVESDCWKSQKWRPLCVSWIMLIKISQNFLSTSTRPMYGYQFSGPCRSDENLMNN